MAGSAGRRDVQRNSAFFLGAFGSALGVLGGGMAGLGLLAELVPDFAQTAPDWFFAVYLGGLLVAIVGAWPGLDWLANHRPGLGALVMAVVGLGFVALGSVAAALTAWGVVGWFAVAGGLILLVAAYLARAGGGTEPLTWHSLRTPKVREVETRLDRVVDRIVGLVSLLCVLTLVAGAIFGADWQTLFVIGSIAVGTALWFVRRGW